MAFFVRRLGLEPTGLHRGCLTDYKALTDLDSVFQFELAVLYALRSLLMLGISLPCRGTPPDRLVVGNQHVPANTRNPRPPYIKLAGGFALVLRTADSVRAGSCPPAPDKVHDPLVGADWPTSSQRRRAGIAVPVSSLAAEELQFFGKHARKSHPFGVAFGASALRRCAGRPALPYRRPGFAGP